MQDQDTPTTSAFSVMVDRFLGEAFFFPEIVALIKEFGLPQDGFVLRVAALANHCLAIESDFAREAEINSVTKTPGFARLLIIAGLIVPDEDDYSSDPRLRIFSQHTEH